jgi:hypothetical protein
MKKAIPQMGRKNIKKSKTPVEKSITSIYYPR